MSLAKLSNVLKIFGGSEPTPEERDALYQEALLMTLSRATSSDTNIDPAEVETVRTVIRHVIGEDVSAADVRIAAKSELYETAPLPKYLSGVAGKLTVEQRVTIARSLADVIRSDEGVREAEVDFYNMVAAALSVTPAELVGLTPNAP